MHTHEILRRLTTALALGEPELTQLVGQAGLAEQIPSPAGLLLPPGDTGHTPCDKATVVALLDALIVQRRGTREGPPPPPQQLDNNLVLKKLRIALSLHDQQMLDIFELAGLHLSRNQLGSMFRAPGNKHFQACSEEQLICFLTGLERSQRS